MSYLKNLFLQVFALLCLALGSSAAMAAAPTPPDGADIVAYIVAAGVVMALVANSKLMMELGIKAFKWIRHALG